MIYMVGYKVVKGKQLMVNSNKILTVSYGTFSCTLEGFDDSFTTMKAIAEYFRDLAADDRYFGAEPPTPDTEMLARIAGKEIERRVEARMEKGSVVLRPSLAAPYDAPETMRAEAATSPAENLADDETSAKPTRQAAEIKVSAAENVAAEPSVTVPESLVSETISNEETDDFADADLENAETPEALAPIAPASVENVAAKLQRIRAVVSTPQDTKPEFTEDEHAEDGPSADLDQNDELAELLADYEEDAEEFDVDDLMSKVTLTSGFDETEEEGDEDFDTAEDLDLAAEVAAELDELEELEALEKLDAQEDLEELEALDAPEIEAPVEPAPVKPTRPTIRARVTRVKRVALDQAVAKGQLEEVEDAVDVVSQAAVEAEVTKPAPLAELSSLEAEAEADLARELAELSAEIEAETQVEEDELYEENYEDEDEDAILAAEVASELDALEELDDDSEELLNAIFDEEDEDDDALLDDDEGDDEPGDDSLLGWDDEEDDTPAPATTAIAAESDDWDDDWEDDEDDEEEARKWAEAEARIKAEEAAEQETSEMEDTIDRLARESVRKTVRMSSPARAMLTEAKVEDDVNSVSRLLDQTNSELDEPEGNRRRSAIAHLRAAVAATRADRILGKKADPETQNQPYREDLADVVRPRHPKAAAKRSERPAPAEKPAPLKLVAEQRVDSPAESAAPSIRPIRPRRVSAAAAAASPRRANQAPIAEGSFGEFAEQVGATELPDLLEAAAAYMSFVEGIEQFSRPQLMNIVLQVEETESSREDRLRSFGQLLRDGKIEKTRGGRFTASDSIGFRPDSRAAG